MNTDVGVRSECILDNRDVRLVEID